MESLLKTGFPIVVYLVAILAAFTGVLIMVAYTVLAERKVLGVDPGRLGRTGLGRGLLQPFADLLKFILGNHPDKSTKFVYFLARSSRSRALMPIVLYPFGPRSRIRSTDLSNMSIVCHGWDPGSRVRGGSRQVSADAFDDRTNRCQCAVCFRITSVGVWHCVGGGRQILSIPDGRAAFVSSMISMNSQWASVIGVVMLRGR
jgi:hypothetical protein